MIEKKNLKIFIIIKTINLKSEKMVAIKNRRRFMSA